MLHFFGACSKKDWYRIESGAWCKHQVVCGAWCMAQNNGSEFHLLSGRILAAKGRTSEEEGMNRDGGSKALGGINPPFYSLIP